jgi:glycosyltransferase involved in cell wall biosynthesis
MMREVLPEVSVVVPTYNRAHTLGASLESLLTQEGVDPEVIVVDDGSTDGTADMLARVRDPRVRVVVGTHAGIAAARNAGIAAARAPVIAFHDSDDLALPGRLAVPLAHLRTHPDVDLVIQNGRMLAPEDEPGAPEKPWIAPAVASTLVGRSIGIAEVFRWNLGQLQGMCFTRRCLEATGPLDTSLTILDDLDLVLRVTLCFRAVFLDAPAFLYRRHPAGVARDRRKVREEAITVAEKLVREHPEALDVLGRDIFALRQSRRYARLAKVRARAGDRRGARAALAEARRLHPGTVGPLAYRLQALLLALRPRG